MKYYFVMIIVFAASLCFSQNVTNDYYIVYNVCEDIEADNYEVYIMNMDGSGKRNLTNAPGVEWCYTAYGDNIYYISDADTAHRHYFLWEMKSDGSGKRRITDFRMADSWHGVRMNGTEFMVRPQSKEFRGFYLINEKGDILSEVLADTNRKNDVAYSPDGSKIAFRMYTAEGIDEIFVADADGSNPVQITTYPADDPDRKSYGYHAGPPRWHPGGEFITYQSKQNGKYMLYAVTPDGNKQWKLRENNELNEGWHDWSPDGKWLAFEGFNDDQSEFNIYLVNWDTKETKRLTDNEKLYLQAPVFVKKK